VSADDGGPPPTEGRVTTAGLELHYLDWGRPTEPAGPPIVLLHGGGLNAHTWSRVCAVLRTDLRCIAPDLRGHGDSDWHPEGDYTLESHAADVGALASALGLDRFVLAGMSLGGSVALTFAGGDRASLVGLVLVDVGPGGSREEGRRRLGALLEGHQEYASIEEVVDRALALNPGRSRERLRRNVELNMRRTPAGAWTWKWDPRIRWRAAPMTEDEERRYAAERSARLWAAAAAVDCPTLVVRGGDSDLFLDEDARRTVAGFRSARLETIPGAGHTVQADRPDELAAVLRAFVERDVA